MENEPEEDFKEPSRLQLVALASTLIIMIIFIAWLSNSGYEPKGAEEKEDPATSRSDEPEEEEGSGGIPAGGGCGIGIGVIVAYWYWSNNSEAAR